MQVEYWLRGDGASAGFDAAASRGVAAQAASNRGEELLEIVMRRYERTGTLLTSNRPVDDWGKLLGDSAAVTAMLDRLLHHVSKVNYYSRRET